jgi:lysophospholipase L1-like esterase
MSSTATDRPRLSLRARRWLTVVVAVVPVLLLFLAAEIYVRATSPHDDLRALTGRTVFEHPIADWALVDAFSAYRGRPGVYHDGPVTKTVNREGYISTPEITPAKPANTIRIAFLGESSTAGTGTLLPDSITWPWQVAELLRRQPGRTSRIDFLNAAMGGFSTFESFGRLWSRVRFYSPDIVVVYHGWNEMYYFDTVDKLPEWRTLPDGSWGLRSSVPIRVYAPRWYDGLLWPSQLLAKVRLRLSRPENGEASAGVFTKVLADSFDHRAPEVFRTNLRLIKAATQVLGMQLFVGKQATLITADLPLSERHRAGVDKHGFSYEAHVEAFAQIDRVIDEEIPADHVIDVTSLSGVPENFYDHIHPTPLGARRTAEIMARALGPAVAALEAARRP